MKKQTYLHLGLPEGEYILSKQLVPLSFHEMEELP